LRDQGRSTDATALLRPVYDRFTEGFDAADLKAAKELLDELDSYNAWVENDNFRQVPLVAASSSSGVTHPARVLWVR
jgi:hypothetical protein